MKAWLKRRAGWLAIVFAALALALGVLVVGQALMLYGQGWYPALGNLSEALAAIATAGAAFVALWVAGQERRDRMQEREDEDKTHARLVYLDVKNRTAVLRRPPSQAAPIVEVTVRNFGPLPVLDVKVSGATWSEHPDARWRSTALNGRGYNILRSHHTDNSYEEMREFGVEFLHPDKEETVVPVTGHYPGGPQLPIYAERDLSKVVIKVQFTTASGIRWESSIQGDSRGEPVRV